MTKKKIRIKSIGEAKGQTRNTKSFTELQGLDYKMLLTHTDSAGQNDIILTLLTMVCR